MFQKMFVVTECVYTYGSCTLRSILFSATVYIGYERDGEEEES